MALGADSKQRASQLGKTPRLLWSGRITTTTTAIAHPPSAQQHWAGQGGCQLSREEPKLSDGRGVPSTPMAWCAMRLHAGGLKCPPVHDVIHLLPLALCPYAHTAVHQLWGECRCTCCPLTCAYASSAFRLPPSWPTLAWALSGWKQCGAEERKAAPTQSGRVSNHDRHAQTQ
jgi:hypothetical protein